MIVWRDGLSVGIAEIDNDHKHLIDITNEFFLIAKKSADPAPLKAVAEKLLDYGYRHFEREERLQVLANYPGYDEQKIQHNALIDALEAFIDRYFVAKREPIDELTIQEMQAFLRTWLIDHIVKTDLKMKGRLTPVD